jgi:hypothetical protein
MLIKQGFVCAICKRPERISTRNGATQALSVDHCHASNKVRGLLCHQCNVGLAKFEDSIETLESASLYLKEAKNV